MAILMTTSLLRPQTEASASSSLVEEGQRAELDAGEGLQPGEQAAQSHYDEESAAETFANSRGISQTTSHWSLQAVQIMGEDDKEPDKEEGHEDGILMRMADRVMSLHKNMLGILCDVATLACSAMLLDLRIRPNPAPLWQQGVFAASIIISGGLGLLNLRWCEEKKPEKTIEKLFPSLVNPPKLPEKRKIGFDLR